MGTAFTDVTNICHRSEAEPTTRDVTRRTPSIPGDPFGFSNSSTTHGEFQSTEGTPEPSHSQPTLSEQEIKNVLEGFKISIESEQLHQVRFYVANYDYLNLTQRPFSTGDYW